jgi:hypothetical protein
VLGWQRWRELDEQGPLGVIRDCLAYAAETGRIEHRHVDTFARIVLAAANEVSLMIARAADPAATVIVGERAFAEFLDRLLGESVTPDEMRHPDAESLRGKLGQLAPSSPDDSAI